MAFTWASSINAFLAAHGRRDTHTPEAVRETFKRMVKALKEVEAQQKCVGFDVVMVSTKWPHST